MSGNLKIGLEELKGVRFTGVEALPSAVSQTGTGKTSHRYVDAEATGNVEYLAAAGPHRPGVDPEEPLGNPFIFRFEVSQPGEKKRWLDVRHFLGDVTTNSGHVYHTWDLSYKPGSGTAAESPRELVQKDYAKQDKAGSDLISKGIGWDDAMFLKEYTKSFNPEHGDHESDSDRHAATERLKVISKFQKVMADRAEKFGKSGEWLVAPSAQGVKLVGRYDFGGYHDAEGGLTGRYAYLDANTDDLSGTDDPRSDFLAFQYKGKDGSEKKFYPSKFTGEFLDDREYQDALHSKSDSSKVEHAKKNIRRLDVKNDTYVERFPYYVDPKSGRELRPAKRIPSFMKWVESLSDRNLIPREGSAGHFDIDMYDLEVKGKDGKILGYATGSYSVSPETHSLVLEAKPNKGISTEAHQVDLTATGAHLEGPGADGIMRKLQHVAPHMHSFKSVNDYLSMLTSRDLVDELPEEMVSRAKSRSLEDTPEAKTEIRSSDGRFAGVATGRTARHTSKHKWIEITPEAPVREIYGEDKPLEKHTLWVYMPHFSGTVTRIPKSSHADSYGARYLNGSIDGLIGDRHPERIRTQDVDPNEEDKQDFLQDLMSNK